MSETTDLRGALRSRFLATQPRSVGAELWAQIDGLTSAMWEVAALAPAGGSSRTSTAHVDARGEPQCSPKLHLYVGWPSTKSLPDLSYEASMHPPWSKSPRRSARPSRQPLGLRTEPMAKITNQLTYYTHGKSQNRHPPTATPVPDAAPSSPALFATPNQRMTSTPTKSAKIPNPENPWCIWGIYI